MSDTNQPLSLSEAEKIIRDYAHSDRYNEELLCSKGDLEGVLVSMHSNSDYMEAPEFMRDAMEQLISDEWNQLAQSMAHSEELIRKNGFDEYFARGEVKKRVYEEMNKYLENNPKENESDVMELYPDFPKRARHALGEGIISTLSEEQLDQLSIMARELELTDKFVEDGELVPIPEPGGGKLVLTDPKRDFFIYHKLTDFVKMMYSRDFLK